jgi:hypothetical protein
MKVQTEVKRMVKIVESPMISIVTEAWQAKDLITVSKKEDYIWNYFGRCLDLFTHVKGHELWGHCWITVRIKHFIFIIISSIILTIVLNAKLRWIVFENANSIGLLVTYLTELSA